MNAIQSLCLAGGTVRITVYRASFSSPSVEFLANVIVSCTIIDKSELIPINIFTVKGTLKRFPSTGKFFLDFKNSKDPAYPNFWFGTGFSDYVSAYTVKQMVDLIPDESTGDEIKRFIEFRVLENGTVENVDVNTAYKQRKQRIADSIVNLLGESHYVEEVLGEQIDIENILGNGSDKSISINT